MGYQCCFTEKLITLYPSPCPTASNNGPTCQSYDVQLEATGGGTYAWSGPAGFSSTSQTPTVTGMSAAKTGIYTVTVTNGGFTSTATTMVSMYTPPSVTASSNSPVPTGQTIQLSATSVPVFSSYLWSGPNGFSATSQNPTLLSSATTGGTYIVTVTDNNNCTSTSSVFITSPAPIACTVTATIDANTAYCEGDSIFFAADGGSFYDWSGPNGWTSMAQNPSITDVSSIHSGTYSVTVTGADGGCTDVASVTLTVFPKPAINAAAVDSTLCAGSTLQLSSNSGSNYFWMGPNSFISFDQNPVITNISTAATGNYFVTVNDINGCINYDTVPVTVLPRPDILVSNVTICEDESVDLTALVTGYNSLLNKTWLLGPLPGTVVATPEAVSPATTSTYYIIGENAEGCKDTAAITITVNQLPDATASSNAIAGNLCNGNTLNLTATGGGTYSWSGP
jgi:hypothetical protein